MRSSRWLLVLVVLAAAAGAGGFASGAQIEVPRGMEAGALPQEAGDPAAEPEQESAAQEGDVEAAPIDPATLPAMDIATTEGQELALRLVETILVEQRLLLSGQNFVYQAGGRRDPFRSLLAVRRREIAAPGLRPPGISGFLINEIQIVATASFQGRWQAMIVGLNGRSYFAQVGAVLYDGRVVEISGDEVTFEQEVEDMLGARSTQRVSKRLVTGNQE